MRRYRLDIEVSGRWTTFTNYVTRSAAVYSAEQMQSHGEVVRVVDTADSDTTIWVSGIEALRQER